MGARFQTNEASEYREGDVARAIEQQTAKVPSDFFLWAAMGSLGAATVMQFTKAKDKGNFVAQWVAPLLLLGVYNKIVKVAGSDRVTA